MGVSSTCRKEIINDIEPRGMQPGKVAVHPTRAMGHLHPEGVPKPMGEDVESGPNSCASRVGHHVKAVNRPIPRFCNQSSALGDNDNQTPSLQVGRVLPKSGLFLKILPSSKQVHSTIHQRLSITHNRPCHLCGLAFKVWRSNFLLPSYPSQGWLQLWHTLC